MPTKTTAYFAYGSNLSREQMARRCPKARPACSAVLPGFRLVFNRRGYATIVPAKGGVVHGAVYICTADDVAELDRFEGVARGCYNRATVTVHATRHGRQSCLVYIDPEIKPGRPTAEYLARVCAGARMWNLPRKYVKRIAATPARPNPPPKPRAVAPLRMEAEYEPTLPGWMESAHRNKGAPWWE